MNIEVGADGKVAFDTPQQRWNTGLNGEYKGVLETAHFAGQRLTVSTDGMGGFNLHYQGFKADGFRTMDAARQAAPEFARRVLARMSEMIAD